MSYGMHEGVRDARCRGNKIAVICKTTLVCIKMTAYYLLLWQIPYTVGSLQLHIPVRKKKEFMTNKKSLNCWILIFEGIIIQECKILHFEKKKIVTNNYF